MIINLSVQPLCNALLMGKCLLVLSNGAPDPSLLQAEQWQGYGRTSMCPAGLYRPSSAWHGSCVHLGSAIFMQNKKQIERKAGGGKNPQRIARPFSENISKLIFPFMKHPLEENIA